MEKLIYANYKKIQHQLSTCLSWNSQIHKYPEHQSRTLTLGLDQLNYLIYPQACTTMKGIKEKHCKTSHCKLQYKLKQSNQYY